MQETSELFKRLLASNHRVETNVTIGADQFGFLINEDGDRILFGGEYQKIDRYNGDIISYPITDNIVFGTSQVVALVVDDGNGGSGYGENMIISVRTSGAAFTGGHPTVGDAFSAEIELKMYKPTGIIERMAKISPWVRLVGEDEVSEWVQKGAFFIDTREYTDDGHGNIIMSIHGYDAMLKAEEMFPLDCPLFDGQEEATDIQVVQYIADRMGVLLDPRTTELLDKGYTVMRPTDYTMREVLRFIAAMYAGNFVISDAEARNSERNLKSQLRFIPLRCIPNSTRYLVDEADGDAITFGVFEIGDVGEVRILV